MELGAKEWVALLSKHRPPSDERVIVIGSFSRKLRIPRDEWRAHFADFGGIGIRKGKEIELVRKASGGPGAELPAWAADRLASAPGESCCLTERKGRFFLKKLNLVRRATTVPGRVVIDAFGTVAVERTYTLSPDIDGISRAGLERMLALCGRFRRDPRAALAKLQGRIGFLARRDVCGGVTRADEEEAASHRLRITQTQLTNGSWDACAIATAFNVIRLLEDGATISDPSVQKATQWLLSTTEPAGLPGLFMLNEELAGRFNAWKLKQARGSSARPHRQTTENEKRKYLLDREVTSSIAASPCELRLTWTSGIVLEALLRAGLHQEPRVVRAINTLITMGEGSGWCGCGYFDTRQKNYVEDSTAPVDFNRFPVWTKNLPHALDWFDGPEEVAHYVCDGRARSARKLGPKKALLTRQYRSTGECAMVIRRALSFHPHFPGTSFETNIALSCTWYQDSYGEWGDAYFSSVCGLLERTSHPLSAFLVLRTVPRLIREQDKDGLWEEAPANDCPAPKREESTLMILRALKRFAFLDELCPERGRYQSP